MTGMVPIIAMVALSSVLIGMALGWYLRRANAWCPHCGDVLSCRRCGGRPTWEWSRPNQRWGR